MPQVVSLTWWRVDEGLPTTDARVLVVYKAGTPGNGGKKSVHFARYAGGQWRFLSSHDKAQSMMPERITHWTPEPRLPRGSPKESHDLF